MRGVKQSQQERAFRLYFMGIFSGFHGVEEI